MQSVEAVLLREKNTTYIFGSGDESTLTYTTIDSSAVVDIKHASIATGDALLIAHVSSATCGSSRAESTYSQVYLAHVTFVLLSIAWPQQ